jgi:hypothetical protein
MGAIDGVGSAYAIGQAGHHACTPRAAQAGRVALETSASSG